MKQIIIVFLLLISLSSFSQVQKKNDCNDRINRLYKQQKIHLIFCCYYFEKVSSFSGADTILSDLPFYRDTIKTETIIKKDSIILANLKKGICNKNVGLISEVQRWCETSKRIAQIRSQVNFTLEGYMELLNKFKKTKSIIKAFLTENKTVYSLSTYEMEGIYFTSISVIKSLEKEEQNRFFKKLKSWDFK